MKTKTIEGVTRSLWCKFMVAQLEPEELLCPSQVDVGRRVLGSWNPGDLLVLDIDTREGAWFNPKGSARSDLSRHQIWVSPLFSSFLTWLYQAWTEDLNTLPDLVDLSTFEGAGGGRPEGPLGELLKICLRSHDKEVKALARTVWTGLHGDTMPAGTPPTLADFKRWTEGNPR